MSNIHANIQLKDGCCFVRKVICVKIRYSAEEMKGWSGAKEREREAHRSE